MNNDARKIKREGRHSAHSYGCSLWQHRWQTSVCLKRFHLLITCLMFQSYASSFSVTPYLRCDKFWMTYESISICGHGHKYGRGKNATDIHSIMPGCYRNALKSSWQSSLSESYSWKQSISNKLVLWYDHFSHLITSICHFGYLHHARHHRSASRCFPIAWQIIDYKRQSL